MQAGYEINVTSDGVRGAYATQEFAAGDVVATLPLSATIPFTPSEGSFPAEHAHELATQMFTNKSLVAKFYPYFATLPAPGAVLSSETFPDSLMSELQSPALESIVSRERRITDAVYLGRLQDPNNPGEDLYESLPKVLSVYGGAKSMPLEAFRHLSSVVSTRELALFTSSGLVQHVMAPVIDMINSDASKTNVELTNDKNSIMIHATKHINRGEELFLEYLPGVDHRPDISLIGYGYVRKVESPILAATDLPTFDPASPYAATPKDDEVFYGPGGKYNTIDEYNRLLSTMTMSGTTLEEDEAKLADKNALKTWQEKAVFEFRVARKKAITQALAAIMDELNNAAVNNALEEAQSKGIEVKGISYVENSVADEAA